MPELAHALGRALLAVIFIVSGYNKLIATAGFVGYLTKLGVPAPQVMAWVVIAVELVGGLMILLGFKTRIVALVLFVFTGVTIFLAHRFWVTPAELNNALKNIAIMGGFLLLYACGPGRLSLDRR